ncbi:hypothetical protein G6F32_015973 [Rhizopus arrhizus]|nr:hypothetical protein G6F32_015973 [Rhizopus arrhizus]
MEGVHFLPCCRRNGDMQRGRHRRGGVQPKRRLAVFSHPHAIRAFHGKAYAQRAQRLQEEFAALVHVADAETDVIEHASSPFGGGLPPVNGIFGRWHRISVVLAGMAQWS